MASSLFESTDLGVSPLLSRTVITKQKINFGQFWAKIFCPFFETFCRFSGKFFCSKLAEMKILLCNVAMGNKLYEVIFFLFMCQKLKLMKQIHLFKKDFVIFLKGATFSDFIETRLWNYKHLAIRIRFPLFWRIFFQLGSNLIK